MSILTVRRDNDKVEILIGTDLANTCDGSKTASIPFTWQMNHTYSADLLARYVEERIYRAVASARCEAYDQGWKDAKAKKSKRNGINWFSGAL